MEQPQRKRQIPCHPQQPESKRKGGLLLTYVNCSIWTKSDSLWKTKSPNFALGRKRRKGHNEKPHTYFVHVQSNQPTVPTTTPFFFFQKNKSLDNCQTMVHNVFYTFVL